MTTIGEYTGLRKPKPWHDGKTCHKSKRMAEAAIRSMQRRAEHDPNFKPRNLSTIQVYPCKEGGERHWHTGHPRTAKS